MKIFYNGKKIPLILPLLNDKLESDFGKKETHFNEFFASKCTPLNNRSTLPHQGLIQKEKVHIDCEKGAQINILANKIATK